MEQLEQKIIETAFKKIDTLSDDELEKLCENYVEIQPELLDYVISASIEYNNAQLEGLIIYYFCIFMEINSLRKTTKNRINNQEVIDFEEEFLEVIKDYFQNENLDVLEEYTDQPELVQFMIMEISTPDEDGTQLEDETAIQLFISCIAMIKLLN
ncbi:MAG: hypothetical protein P8I93_08920 [Crocinitomicaceae bacterium]|nr:hypothetical protein [Crocinitomicaceae bacterium]